MRKNYCFLAFLIIFLAYAGSVSGQCPGPAVRTALLNLQKSISNPTFYTAQNALAGQVPVSDTCGNLRYTRYVVISDTCLTANPFGPVIGLPPSTFIKICGTDSLFYIDWRREPIFLGEAITITQIIDSLQNDTAFFNNWYTRNDTTTDLLRTASVLRSAQWRTVDSLGFIRWSNRPDGFDGPQVTVWQDSVVMDADTVLWRSSYNQPRQYHDFLADGTYFHQDSLKVGAWGQFPAFPALNLDNTERGFFYNPSGNEIAIINGSFGQERQSYIYFENSSFTAFTQDATNATLSQIFTESTDTYTIFDLLLDRPGSIINQSSFSARKDATQSMFKTTNIAQDTMLESVQYFGYGPDISNQLAFGAAVRVGEDYYSFIQTYLPNDTTTQTVSFYNRAYYFPNDRPSNTLGDTSVIVWIGDGTNAGKHPEFVPLPGAGSTVNWYNSNGTTTDNTRIADVLETATWRSDNVTQDGIVPFRFEIAGVGANEPENMVWAFPSGDSAMIYQADQEIVLFTNNSWLLRADGQASVQSDSFSYGSNSFGTAFRVGQHNVVSQNSISTPTHKDAIEYNSITGTGQTEIFLDGSSAVWRVPTNAVQNFKIHLAAICSNAGNGVGISTGESFAGWYLGGIKRVGSTTSLIGSVQNAATAQADTGMATSTVTIDADDTDESLRIRFTPPSTAGTTTVIQVTATIEIIQTSY